MSQASEVYTKLIDTSRGTRVRPSLVYPMLAQSLHAQGKLKEAEKRLRKCLDLCFGVDGDPEEDYDTVESACRAACTTRLMRWGHRLCCQCASVTASLVAR